METIKKYLNYIGLALILVALVSLIIWPQRKTACLIILVVGFVSLITYTILNLSVLKQGFSRRSFLYSSNLLLIILIVLAILVLVNYFLARHHYRLDFTEAKLHSLSDQSIKVVKNLKQDVLIKGFFREGNMSRSKMESLLNLYTYHSKRIKFEFVDPDKNPGEVKRYGITQDGTTIFESGGNENRITGTTEEDITNAVIKVTREKKKVIYFLEGHGEGSIEVSEEAGFSTAKDELQKLGYEVKKLTLALSETFPQDCALLVIPGPKKDLLPNEVETVSNYLNKGGRVFFMIDPETAPGLVTYLQGYGIDVGNDVVVDTISRLFGGDYFMPMVTDYGSHEITNNFRYATFFPYARSVDAAAKTPEGVTITSILKTSENSWSERQLDQKTVTFDKDKDKQGPISLAVVATIKPKEIEKDASSKTEEKAAGEQQKPEEKPEAPKTKAEGRMAVFGDSDFASNRYFNLSGNGNLCLNTVNWLTEEADLISIQPKTSSPRTIQLTPSQGRMVFFFSVIILPLIILILGVSVWVRRRSL
jgi:ABC-type uncharacterized transport system involved in gliding motility auxiliary subunit